MAMISGEGFEHFMVFSVLFTFLSAFALLAFVAMVDLVRPPSSMGDGGDDDDDDDGDDDEWWDDDEEDDEDGDEVEDADSAQPVVNAAPCVYRGFAGTFVHFKGDRDYSEQLTPELVVFRSIETGEIVGCRIANE